MYRLPPPDWNTPPSHINGDFLMHNMAVPSRGAFAPFMPGSNTNYHPWSQPVVPKAPFYGGSTFNNNQQFHQGQQQYHKINDEPNNRGTVGSTGTSMKEYSCDVCERFFNTKQILDTHLATHVECEQEGCIFKASRKILKLHYIQNHAEGRMRIVLETPEQIEKWRQERRKKYPTVANVEKKLVEEKEKRDKGQVARDRTFRYRGNQRFHNNQKKGPNHHRNKRKFPNQNDIVYHKNDQQNGCQPAGESETSEKKCQLQDGDPLSLVLLSEENGCGDSEVIKTEQTSEVQKYDFAPDLISDSPPSALMSLCASYGDMSSDEESVAPSEINHNNNKEDEPSSNKTEHSPAVKRNMEKEQSNSSPRRRKRTREQRPQRNMKNQAKKKRTLLEKLLAPEIRHESNVILQCIRYIVEKNFFEAVSQENDVVLSFA